MSSTLLEQFLRDECTPHVRALLREAFNRPNETAIRRRFEFNRFDVEFDYDTRQAKIIDDLDVTDAGIQTIGIDDFAAAIERGSFLDA